VATTPWTRISSGPSACRSNYTGLTGKARLKVTSDVSAGAKGKVIDVVLDGRQNAIIQVTIPAKGRIALYIEGAGSR